MPRKMTDGNVAILHCSKMNMNILHKICSPDDVKQLDEKDLSLLCSNIRKFLIENIVRTGGHLSSNLGVVELTIALHRAFDFAREDNIVFDVSHQAYIHKIITGRKRLFCGLRQYGGLSGYTNPRESSCDQFLSAHAGTGISMALGMSIAKRLLKKSGRVVVLVGDAGLATGVSFEALNHWGESSENLIVVLNDNQFSISLSVGALSLYLNKIRKQVQTKHMSWFSGRRMADINFESGLRKKLFGYDIFPGHFFRDMGIRYFGPFDGHDILQMLSVFERVSKMSGPILLHVLTRKGEGYKPAVMNPVKYHGVSGLSPFSGVKEDVSFTKFFSDALLEEAQQDPCVVGITAAMSSGTGLSALKETMPHSFFDVGIGEQHAVALASGLAKQGMKPICALYSTFLQRAYDQIFQELCLNNARVILMLDRAGIVGEDGATHAGVFDIAFLRVFPGIVLMSPKDGVELKAMLRFALHEMDGVVAIRYPKDNSPKHGGGFLNTPIKLGRFECLLKGGDDLRFVAYGFMSSICLRVAERLSKHGVSVGLWNARFAKPMDARDVCSIVENNIPIITVEEHMLAGGFGSAFMERVSELGLPLKFIWRIGLHDVFVPQGKRSEVMCRLKLDDEAIFQFAWNILVSQGLVGDSIVNSTKTI